MAQEKVGSESQITVKNMVVIVIPGVLAIILFIYSLFNYFGQPFFDDMILFSFLIGVIPFALMKYFEFSRMRKMENEFPNFLADVASGVDSGMSIPQAIYVTKDREYGLLNKEITKMAQQISWGIPFEQVFSRFTKRTKSPYIEKLTYLIIEANKAGGDIKEIVGAAARNARDLKNIERETETMIKPYIFICYITYFVFLVVILILYKTFILPMTGETSGFIDTGFSAEEYTSLFFRMLMFQGLFIGLAAGKMAERRIIAGLKHSIILIMLGYFMFNAVTEWGLF
ncbi:MAG: type II secretion system F family protein [Theionarchaea archaeon]|nr:type II secretion system F family protein [Theionarchaea archaeon]